MPFFLKDPVFVNTLILWKRLFTCTVPVIKAYLTGTVPFDNIHLTGTLFLSCIGKYFRNLT